MATRLLEDKTRMADHRQTLAKLPGIPSGWLDESTQIKAKPGYFCGIIFTLEEEEQARTLSKDIGLKALVYECPLRVWDTNDGSTTAAEVIMLQTSVTEFGYYMFPLPGIEAKLGIYVQIDGECAIEYEIYYK